MARPLNVLFLSSEVEPFVKTGGLADVSSALPQTIKQLGHEIRIMMPCYGSINQRTAKLHEIKRLKDIRVTLGGRSFPATVKSSFIGESASRLQVYFLDNPELLAVPDYMSIPQHFRTTMTTTIDFSFSVEGFLMF